MTPGTLQRPAAGEPGAIEITRDESSHPQFTSEVNSGLVGEGSVMSEIDRSLCVDCGVDTCPCDERRGCRHAGRWEHYMVHDDVWAAAGMETDGGYMCIGCLESRIGRQLTLVDFTDYPINDPNPWNTTRLASRNAVTA